MIPYQPMISPETSKGKGVIVKDQFHHLLCFRFSLNIIMHQEKNK